MLLTGNSPARASGPALSRQPDSSYYVPRYGQFLQPDPLGYDDGPNLYGYAAGDPVNNRDPTGTTCAYIRQAGSVKDDGQGGAIITASKLIRRCWDDSAGGNGDGGRGLGRRGGWVNRIGEAIDAFAEKRLKPPEARQATETFAQCMKRLTGNSPALGIVGAFSIGAGGAWLGYYRVGLAGGGGGTSLISSAARGAFGGGLMGRGVLGTGSLGGAIGRGLSKGSVVAGAAAVGWTAGTAAGAVQKCR